MANINMRLYAEQIYGLSSSFLNEYIFPSIEKENFISMFKNGLIQYDKINTKKEIKIYYSISMSNILLNSLEVNIPDENSHLIINIKGFKSNLLLSKISENDLEEIMILQKKNLKEKFIKDLFNKITNKTESSSFIEGLIENIIKKIIDGLQINISNVELLVQFEKFQFLVKINNLEITIENKELKIDFKGLSISYINDINTKLEEDIISKSDINLKFIIKDKENAENDENKESNEPPCHLKININILKINLNSEIIQSVFDIINYYRDIKYNKIYHRYKKLIYFHRPKNDNNNKNYKLLWLYAINTIIKLRKLICFNDFNIFELLNSTQQKIIENQNNNENYILCNNINLLCSTKNIVEKKIIDSKDSIANKFFSFFSTKSEEKTLTEEEKKMLEDAYEKKNLEKYLLNGGFENNNNEKEIIKKIKYYLSNFEINIILGKILITFNNKCMIKEDEDLNKSNIYISKIIFCLKYLDNKCKFNININDIGKNENESFGTHNIVDKDNHINNNDLLQILYDKNDLNFYLGKNIEIPENILYLIICYSNFIKQNIINYNKWCIFHKVKKEKNKNDKNQLNIKIPFLPSLTLLTNDKNKIDLSISDCSWTNKLISFKLELKDLYSKIIDNCQFNILKDEENQKYTINLVNPLNVNISSNVIQNLIKNYKIINNSIFSGKVNKDLLFDFKFIKYNNNLNNIELFNNNIIILINDLNCIIKDNENATSIKLKDFNFKYENKDLLLNTKEFSFEIDLLSLEPLFKEIQEIKTNDIPSYYKHKYNFINIYNEMIKSLNININNTKGYLYITHKIYYIDLIADSINGNSDSKDKQIMNFSVNKINMNWVYVPDTLKIIESKNINLDLRINTPTNLIVKLYIESPTLSSIFLVFNFQTIKEMIKKFLSSKIVYEIKITNIKSEIFKTYLKHPDDKIESELSIYLTNFNFNKKDNNEKMDLIHLEQYGLNYNLESHTNIIFKLEGKYLRFFGSQRDVSFLFFSVLRPDKENEKKDSDNFYDLLNSISLDIKLYEIKLDFYKEKQYDNIFFDFCLGNLLLNLKVFKKQITDFKIGLNQIKMNLYEDNIDDNKMNPLRIIDYEISHNYGSFKISSKRLFKKEEENQIDITIGINNTISISISKINILFIYDKLLSIFYYFNDISVFDLINNIKKSQNNKSYKENNMDIQIFFKEIQFQFPMDYFNQNNCINLYFNQFDLAYIKIINDSVLDHRIRFSLNNIKMNNHKRKIIFSEEEYLLFVLNIKENNEENNSISIFCNSLLNNLLINLTCKDIILLDKIIIDIQKLFQNINQINIKDAISTQKYENKKYEKFMSYKSSTIDINKIEEGEINEDKNNKNINIFSKINSIICEINIESINIALLDENNIFSCNNGNYFYPFLNLKIFNIKINYESNKNNKDNYPYIKLNSSYNILINYYNDIIKEWEPITEDLTIKLDYVFKAENNKLVDNYTLEINKLIINISDIFINTLLIRFNDWIYRLNKQFNYLRRNNKRKKIIQNNNIKDNDNIILKYIIHNCTDLNVFINYHNKKYILNHSKNLYIEYDNIKEFENNNNLSELFAIKFDDNKNNKIVLFAKEFGIKKITIYKDNIEREIYIETKINKNKHIDIFIFNSIIIKNNTNYTLDIYLNWNNNESEKITFLPDSTFGLPINFIQYNNSNFKVELNKEKNIKNVEKTSLTETFYLKDLLSDDLNKKINQDIIFKDINISLSLLSKIKSEKYREIIISHKYCIINCLPCSLFIRKNEDENNLEIKKNSLYNVDDTSILIGHNSIKLMIKILDNYFYSKLSLMRNETKKLIKFTSSNNKESLILPLLIKETSKTKAIIIYSEYILHNESGIELNVSSQNENNQNFCYNIGNDLYLISSDIKKSNSFICIKSNKNLFLTNYIPYEEIKNNKLFEFTLNFEDKLKVNQYNFDLIINKNNSNLWCINDKNNFIDKIKEEFDFITIYRIIPKYNIINFTAKTNIKENNINIILKDNKKYYMAINAKNIEYIREIENYYIFDNLSINSLYTICIGENLYNVEVKKAKKGGYKDIFIFNNNLKHSQVVVENKTNYDICLKQKKYEKYKQEIKKNETQILKIYEQTNHDFSAQIDNKLYYLNLNDFGKKQLINNLYINIEQNIKSKKIIFYIQKNEDYFQKSKSVMNLPKINYNFKINFSPDNYIKINIILNQIIISLIGQNNNNINQKNNANIYDFERKEIALLFINDFQCGIKLAKPKRQILQKKNNLYHIQLNIKILNCEIYNLLMENIISCLCTNTTSPLIHTYSEFNYEIDKNRIKIIELVSEIGDIRLNITPKFLKEIYAFIKDIIIKMDLHNKIVDNIFIGRNNNYINLINNNFNYHPLSIIIEKIDFLGIKIKFKLNKKGLETLPKLIIDFIEYLKCFPFFAIDKETTANLGQIYFEGPFKDFKTLFDKLKLKIIAQLSKEIVIKVLHPSTNEIKENINNMIGYDNKIAPKNNNDENVLRVKNKRIFIGKNQIYKKYNKNNSILMQKIKEDLKIYKDKYVIDIIHQNNNILFLFDNCLLYINDRKKQINYNNIKELKYEKNKITIKYNKEKEKDELFELLFSDEIISKKIYEFLLFASK